jgi:uncharacterized membrane protein
MPHFELFSMLRWLHIVCFALGGGSAMVILVLVGFEESREDLRGLTSILWKRTTCWGFRLAFLVGLALLGWKAYAGEALMGQVWLHFKLPLAILLLVFSEMAPRALANRKRGAPLLAFLLFLVTVFVSTNAAAFGVRASRAPLGPYTGTVTPDR